MPKDKLLRIINNKNKRERKGLFKSKKEENKNTLFYTKKGKHKKKSLQASKKNLFKSKIEVIEEILYDLIINRDEKIEEIKKKVMIQEIIFLNQKKIIISQ